MISSMTKPTGNRQMLARTDARDSFRRKRTISLNGISIATSLTASGDVVSVLSDSLSYRCEAGQAVAYILKNWLALTRYLEDGLSISQKILAAFPANDRLLNLSEGARGRRASQEVRVCVQVGLAC